MVEILKMYKDPVEIVPIIENFDIEGRDCFWYIANYQIFRLLETKIMNQYIIEKWYGGLDLNSSILDLATSYSLFINKNDIYSTDNTFSKLWIQISTFDKSNKVHPAKFHSWKHSMKLRYWLDLGFLVLVTVIFQIYIAGFNHHLHEA